MSRISMRSRKLGLLLAILPLLGLFVYVVIRSGPLAAVPVTVTQAKVQSVTPSVFGIGTVSARYTYKVGPVITGRLLDIAVNVGDTVKAGQIVGQMDPIDLDERIHSQERVLKRVSLQHTQAQVKFEHAGVQLKRYRKLFASRSSSEESLNIMEQEYRIAQAGLEAAAEDIIKAKADLAALMSQRKSLQLIAPVEGIVTSRNADPGSTVVAGQAVLEMINPAEVWIEARFDQSSSIGLEADLPASIVLRTRGQAVFPGKISRIEPKADVVTEEMLAKVSFIALPQQVPSLGELSEVTVHLPEIPGFVVIPNASLVRVDNQQGVWRVVDKNLQFAAVQPGVIDLDGNVQIIAGLQEDDQVVVYSEKALTAKSRILITDQIPGVAQ
ncbi:efflux RND transporter periplasmic adaptor subunit [Advenella alkanexedens]|uniref:efflux RND transporter periplasmic adaptor subunit n=1 Tax=Advenella alkanexedens TaxID=1481665 RepID=UPI002676F5A2|nr:efflux RND transporter periplasmic adaptor subunit [Advenella alkanexedens]WKU19392.1 efflux RND transporter periplasmic adaptor subunit [Advenella alkanexedens]